MVKEEGKRRRGGVTVNLAVLISVAKGVPLEDLKDYAVDRSS